MDESISAWRGKDGNYCSDGMPHVTKIKRKPKGVGAELKDAAYALKPRSSLLLIFKKGRKRWQRRNTCRNGKKQVRLKS